MLPNHEIRSAFGNSDLVGNQAGDSVGGLTEQLEACEPWIGGAMQISKRNLGSREIDRRGRPIVQVNAGLTIARLKAGLLAVSHK
jgi:hypothetical protein